jgi:hypothetical protein
MQSLTTVHYFITFGFMARSPVNQNPRTISYQKEGSGSALKNLFPTLIILCDGGGKYER